MSDILEQMEEVLEEDIDLTHEELMFIIKHFWLNQCLIGQALEGNPDDLARTISSLIKFDSSNKQLLRSLVHKTTNSDVLKRAADTLLRDDFEVN